MMPVMSGLSTPAVRPGTSGVLDLAAVPEAQPAEQPRRRLPAALTAAPGWIVALSLYGVARLVSAVLVGWLQRYQPATSWGAEAAPGYWGVLSNWDGLWYRMIAEAGYPGELPVRADGSAVPSELAFYPLYPGLVRGVMELTGLPFAVAGGLVSLACGAGAAVLLHVLVRERAGTGIAAWAVLLWAVFPSAPVLQMTYTESLAALLLLAVLRCLQQRRYLAAAPLVLLAGMSRAIRVPLLVVVLVHAFVRLYTGLRYTEPMPTRQLVPLAVTCASAAVGAFAWFGVVAVIAGRVDAYARVQAAWRGGDAGWRWPDRAHELLGPLGLPLVGLVLLAWLAWVLRPASREALGPDLLAWAVVYPAYLVAAADLWTSLPRFLLLLLPLPVLLAGLRGRHLVAVAFVGLQAVWIAALWLLGEATWFPP